METYQTMCIWERFPNLPLRWPCHAILCCDMLRSAMQCCALISDPPGPMRESLVGTAAEDILGPSRGSRASWVSWAFEVSQVSVAMGAQCSNVSLGTSLEAGQYSVALGAGTSGRNNRNNARGLKRGDGLAGGLSHRRGREGPRADQGLDEGPLGSPEEVAWASGVQYASRNSTHADFHAQARRANT